jgi:transposase-like protein
MPAAGRIHLRMLHYLLSSVFEVVEPDDKAVYTNSFEHWRWLQNRAAKAARWLQYVSFDDITDNRNDPPLTGLPPRSCRR